MSLASDERQALASLLLDVGPAAPTLCEGWTTLDLAAHLVTRQDRPDAQAGIVLRPLARWTERVRAGATGDPYPELVKHIRSGPPWWSPQSIGALDEATNGLEYLVHHEDVLRAQPGWTPRTLPPAMLDEIWRRGARAARLMVRHAPVGVALARPEAESALVRPGSPVVTVRGEPVELVLWAFGRTSVADVTFEGDDAAVAQLETFRARV